MVVSSCRAVSCRAVLWPYPVGSRRAGPVGARDGTAALSESAVSAESGARRAPVRTAVFAAPGHLARGQVHKQVSRCCPPPPPPPLLLLPLLLLPAAYL